MSKEQKIDSNKRYFSIIDGTFRTQVPPTHPEAIARNWESSDGKTGIKYEREVRALFGKIVDVQFHEGDFGKNLNIVLDPDEDGISPVISVGTATRYGEDLLKKLPSVDLSQEVRIRPFSFIPDGEENKVQGVEITHQDSEGKFTIKVSNFFWDAETKTPTNGYPIVDFDKEKADSDDWKVYFTLARKFMVKYVEENIIPKFSAQGTTYPESAGEAAF